MGVNYKETIERMRWAGKLKNDSAIARVVGVTPQALSNYKKKGEIPSDLVLRYSNIFGLSLDWLITGEGEMYRSGVREQGSGARSYLVANEAISTYGVSEKERTGNEEFSTMSADEIIYMGKLLKVLRSKNDANTKAVKNTIDAFLETMEVPVASKAG